jgi:hypothetical protein
VKVIVMILFLDGLGSGECECNHWTCFDWQGMINIMFYEALFQFIWRS